MASKASTDTERIGEEIDSPGGEGFGKFLAELNESFTVANAVNVATALGFPAAQMEGIKKDTDGHVFTELLLDRGIITQLS